ncbi:MAG: acyltransferase [Gaiellales bacterium]|nr:MAG: acyltransferase [Gaiellales bacterium]
MVIANHAHPFRELSWSLNEGVNQAASFAVPFFFIVAGYLFASRPLGLGAPGRWARYMRRLLLVFVSWSTVYLLLPLSLTAAQVEELGPWGAYRHYLEGRYDWIMSNRYEFLTQGTSFHLWFLVSLAMAVTLVYVFDRLGIANKVFLVAIPMYLFTIVTRYYVLTPVGIEVGFNTRNGPFVSTLYVALGAALARSSWRPSPRLAWATLGAGLAAQLAEAFFIIEKYGQPSPGPYYIFSTVPFALGFMFVALARPGLGEGTVVARWGLYTLGVYAAHMVMVTLLGRMLPLPPAVSEILVAPLAFLTSLGLAVILARNRFSRRIVI